MELGWDQLPTEPGVPGLMDPSSLVNSENQSGAKSCINICLPPFQGSTPSVTLVDPWQLLLIDI